MEAKRSNRVTSIMNIDSAIDFTRRTSIDRFKIKKVIAENTGEASLLLTEDEGTNQVIKLYHSNTKPDERIERIIEKINSPYVMPHRKGGVYDERYYEILPFFEDFSLWNIGFCPRNREMLLHKLEKCIFVQYT